MLKSPNWDVVLTDLDHIDGVFNEKMYKIFTCLY